MHINSEIMAKILDELDLAHKNECLALSTSDEQTKALCQKYARDHRNRASLLVGLQERSE
ncbi:hypothetical protein Pan153_31020 [Gimesia panareensis]|uniref:Uncharacterized protein n=1 Tax=Gimesia panareensis TaxID=2527978 RepID=A0A518FQ15_9PLAN|nr:hypothetical protein Enr10x_07720 [Gimesia panareensis]QDV18444.1 hypothetical protein Pan153_31020 [Gimesia panareensis]